MLRAIKVLLGVIAVAAIVAYPMIPGLSGEWDGAGNRKSLDAEMVGLFGKQIGSVMASVFILGILALALNIVVGYTGLLHLGIAAFFGIGAFITGILTVQQYPFQWGFLPTLIASTLGCALIGVFLSAPTLRLRGDYLALVTLGFGLIAVTALRNFEEITGGMQTLNPVPPPKIPEFLKGRLEKIGITPDWAADYRLFYYFTLFFLVASYFLLRNVERSRIGRAWVALREDELASTCMGLNAARLKLAAVGSAAGLAGLAGCLFAIKNTNTLEPTKYDFQLSATILCCLILGGLGNRAGVLLGVFLVTGYDQLLAPVLDGQLQARNLNPNDRGYLKFSSWNLLLFGLALIIMMRFRPEGILPARRDAGRKGQGQ